MRRFLKIMKGIFLAILMLIISFFLFVHFTWEKKFDAPYPDIHASHDSLVIARGKYLANGPAHCGGCHVPMDQVRSFDEGKELNLIGGWELSFPGFGTFRAPNITPDKTNGIGRFTDQEIARSLRYGVGTDGRALFPMMPFQGMSDQDLTAVISYLRSLPAVYHPVEDIEYGFMAKALFSLGMWKPEGPKNDPVKSIPIDSTVEYGKYLAYHVSNCVACHTEVDMSTGKVIGKDFAGKAIFDPDAFSEGYSYISPNLTPDPETGVMSSWSEQQFIDRFKQGRIHRGSPMPWGSFSRMNQVELKALYRFLNSLDPVKNEIGQTVFPPDQDKN